MVAPTASADRLNVAATHASLASASWTSGLDLRSVGPTVMSGRVVDLAVNPDNPAEFVVAYATGGIWHTTDQGTSFQPLFDHELMMFVGALAVDWQNRHIWVGTGEVNSSRSSYAGIGVYLSEDWGGSWQHLGLSESHHIGRIVLDEDDGVYVAALGPLYTEGRPETQRGIYHSTDQGASWQLLLNGTEAGRPEAGAIDLIVDPNRTDHLYAALWDRTRRSWDFTEGGPGSGVFESEDGGASWVYLSSEEYGFPASENIGRMGLAYHAAADKLYVIVDNQNVKPEEEEEEDSEVADLKGEDFRGMTTAEFAALDSAALADFLEDNGFPEEADATSVFRRVADGELTPAALADFLGDANAAMFNPPIIGAEVYRWTGQSLQQGKTTASDSTGARWERTHEEGLDEVCYSYCYYFGLIAVDPSECGPGGDRRSPPPGKHRWRCHLDFHCPRQRSRGPPPHLDRPPTIRSTSSTAMTAASTSPSTAATIGLRAIHPLSASFTPSRWTTPTLTASTAACRTTAPGAGPADTKRAPGGTKLATTPTTASTGATACASRWTPATTKRSTQGINSVGTAAPTGRPGTGPDCTQSIPSVRTPLRWNWQTPIHLSRHHQDVLYMGSNRVPPVTGPRRQL